MAKYKLSCCGKVVDVDNKPKWCLACAEHNIEVTELDDVLSPCPFCGGKAGAECLNSISLYWYECETCGGASGSGEDWVEAQRKWNMRDDKI